MTKKKKVEKREERFRRFIRDGFIDFDDWSEAHFFRRKLEKGVRVRKRGTKLFLDIGSG